MEILKKLSKLLPSYEDISNVCSHEAEANFILKLAAENMKCTKENFNETPRTDTEEISYLLQCLVDKCWERIHTGHFSEVPLNIRKIYAIANYYKIFYNLIDSSNPTQVEKCSQMLDDAMLIGCTKDLYAQNDSLQQRLMEYFDQTLVHADMKLPTLEPLKRQVYPCDIPQITCPSVEIFRKRCFDALQPTLLLDTIKHWPAVRKWRDLNYILKTAGNRRVPIEIGSNYATDEWSQQLVKIRDFLNRQFLVQESVGKEKNVEYLAQHELFDQIPALKSDICVPDYCTLGKCESTAVDIKAWLGPSGTISPLHFDPKHNLLCQVFGAKRIILAEPIDTPNLYAHETEFLSNTSQIDAAQPNIELFPLIEHVKFYNLTLQEGDCLYIPPKWWHYVRSLSESFSVSFWWE